MIDNKKILEESISGFEEFKIIYLNNINNNFNLKNTLFPFSVDLGKQAMYYVLLTIKHKIILYIILVIIFL